MKSKKTLTKTSLCLHFHWIVCLICWLRRAVLWSNCWVFLNLKMLLIYPLISMWSVEFKKYNKLLCIFFLSFFFLWRVSKWGRKWTIYRGQKMKQKDSSKILSHLVISSIKIRYSFLEMNSTSKDNGVVLLTLQGLGMKTFTSSVEQLSRFLSWKASGKAIFMHHLNVSRFSNFHMKFVKTTSNFLCISFFLKNMMDCKNWCKISIPINQCS